MSPGVQAFVLVVGIAAVLSVVLQVLILAYTVDAAKSVRRLVELGTPQPIHVGLTREDPKLIEKLQEKLADIGERAS